MIGTDYTGTTAIENDSGIQLENGSGNTIGGTGAHAGNLISGDFFRAFYGIDVESDSNDLIEGNLVGTDVTGATALGSLNGMHIYGNNNTIGGTTAGAGNVIFTRRDWRQ